MILDWALENGLRGKSDVIKTEFILLAYLQSREEDVSGFYFEEEYNRTFAGCILPLWYKKTWDGVGREDEITHEYVKATLEERDQQYVYDTINPLTTFHQIMFQTNFGDNPEKVTDPFPLQFLQEASKKEYDEIFDIDLSPFSTEQQDAFKIDLFGEIDFGLLCLGQSLSASAIEKYQNYLQKEPTWELYHSFLVSELVLTKAGAI